VIRVNGIGLIGAALSLVVATTACHTGPSSNRSTGDKLPVVAAEDFWGSLARQLGGDRVQVRSLITNPATDPHDYEPTPTDARATASARYVIVNGIGYDPWVDKLLSVDRPANRRVLRVGDVAGLEAGDNPHQWYSPVVVEQVTNQITADLKRLDPKDATYFDQQRDSVETAGLAGYKALLGQIKATYAGTPVGASESVFSPLADALGLRLVTPPSFLDAISEGNEPSSADKAAVDQQIASRSIKVFVFNSQNATPDVQRLVDAAKANGIAVTTITETVTPRGASFQQWQTAQLRDLQAALAAGTAR
jgi:zinc/manganese transport system substrate-binding protein